MSLRRGLFIYCIVAIVALLVIGWLQVSAAVQVGASLRVASEVAEPVKAEAELLRRTVSMLEDEQRRRRSGLSPEEAIDVSSRIQLAQRERDSVEAQLAEQETQVAALQAKHESLKVRLVPVIGLLLIHIIGLLLFSPRDADSKRAPGPGADRASGA